MVQYIDEPLKGDTFDDIMNKVKDENHELIESAVGINIEKFINQLVNLINSIKKDHEKLLVHVHQYTGTTILDKILEEKAGVSCILDKTNFFESPINYEKEYSNIDGLISISKCAGLGLKAGEWLVPQYFMDFDVKEGIIYSSPKYVVNHIKTHLKFNYVEAPVLVVNGLWNPDMDNERGYLVLDVHAEKVYNFVKKNTEIFDETHN